VWMAEVNDGIKRNERNVDDDDLNSEKRLLN
jgi:hypothetical protein